MRRRTSRSRRWADLALVCRIAWSAALAPAAAGCEGPSFESPSIVASPRLLAVVADPPVVAPGTDVTLTPFAVAPDATPSGGARFDFALQIDLGVDRLAAAAGQTLGDPAEPVSLPFEGGRAILPGSATRDAIDRLLEAVGDAPPGTAEHVVRHVYEQVGLVAEVDLVMRTPAGVVVEGFKRILLSADPVATENPPPPRFSIGGRWVSGRGAEPFACPPEDGGEPPRVRAGQIVTLAPDEDDAAWLESYPALDIEGRLLTGHENAYYSWFSTGGDFSLDVTRAPEREVDWTAPEEPGTYPLWLVVRDGHLGTSACRTRVEVVP